MAANITSVKSPLLPVFIFPSTQETIDLPTQQFIIRTIPRINRFSRVYDYNHEYNELSSHSQTNIFSMNTLSKHDNTARQAITSCLVLH